MVEPKVGETTRRHAGAAPRLALPGWRQTESTQHDTVAATSSSRRAAGFLHAAGDQKIQKTETDSI